MISVPDWLLVTVQWVHHMGAVAWVGGSIFFKFVLQPALRTSGTGPDSLRAVGHEFGSIVRIAIIILIVTGAFMAVVHLSAGGNSRLYIGLLALKIALAFYMFLVVWLRRRSAPSENAGEPIHLWTRLRRGLTSTTALLILGVAVIGLADVLGAVGGHGSGGHGSGGHSEVVEEHVDVETTTVSDDGHEHEESVDAEEDELESSQPDEESHSGESDEGEDDKKDDHDHDH